MQALSSGCSAGYYQYNFECYKNCPENTKANTSTKECELTGDFNCYIDENYKTHCDDYEDNKDKYKYRYQNTNIFLSSCDDSTKFFNTITYLYNDACLNPCPSGTKAVESSKKCEIECEYKTLYLDSSKTNHKCLLENEKCEDNGKYILNEEEKACIILTEQECIDKDYKIFNKFCLNDCSSISNSKIVGNKCECKFKYFLDNNDDTNCLEDGIDCKDVEGYKIESDINRCFSSQRNCLEDNTQNKFFNNICYTKGCPDNSGDNNNDGICECENNYYYPESKLNICFDNTEICDGGEYPYIEHNGNECFKTPLECKNKEKYIFNYECYNDNCPDNSSPNNNNICLCSFNFYYDNTDDLFTCLGNGELCKDKGFSFNEFNGKECFKTKNECNIKNDNKGKIFNNECYINGCPINTDDNDNDGICSCSFNFYYDSTNDLYICLGNNEKCEDKGYQYNENNGKECFKNKNECNIKNDNKGKIFNNECYINGCPDNSGDNNNDGICECENNYYNQIPNIYTCFTNTELCKNEEYPYKENSGKECFKTKNECKLKGKYIFNYECYNDRCPPNTNSDDNDNNICSCSNYYYYDTDSGLYTCLESGETCESKNYPYIDANGKQCYKKISEC